MFVDGNGYILGTAVIVTSILQQSEICLDYKCGFSSFCHRNCHFDLSSPHLCSGGTWCRLCILRAWALLYFTGNEQFPTPGYWMHTVSMGSVVCLWAAFSSLFSQDICDVTWTTQTARLVAGRHLLHFCLVHSEVAGWSCYVYVDGDFLECFFYLGKSGREWLPESRE